MRSLGTRSLLRSAKRLAEGEQEYEKTKGKFWPAFLKRESTILVRRAVRVWLRLRIGRRPWKGENTN